MNLLTVAAAAALLVPQTAMAAGLLGSTATVGYRFPDLATPYGNASFAPAAFTIGAGEETVVDIEGVTDIHADFAAASLSIVFATVLANPTWTGTSFNGPVFTGTGFAAITGVTVLPSSTFAGFDQSRVSIVGDTLRLDWGGLSYVDGTTLNLVFSFVPEPATWAMLVVGFGLAGVAMRRRPAVLAA